MHKVLSIGGGVYLSL